MNFGYNMYKHCAGNDKARRGTVLTRVEIILEETDGYPRVVLASLCPRRDTLAYALANLWVARFWRRVDLLHLGLDVIDSLSRRLTIEYHPEWN